MAEKHEQLDSDTIKKCMESAAVDLRNWFWKYLEENFYKEKWNPARGEVEVGEYCLFETQNNAGVYFGWRMSQNFFQTGTLTVPSVCVKQAIKIERHDGN